MHIFSILNFPLLHSIFIQDECLDLPPITRKTIKIEVEESVLDEYQNIIATMKQKVKSNYKKQYAQNNNNNNHNNEMDNSGSGCRDSSCLELMSQLRMFSSKAKVLWFSFCLFLCFYFFCISLFVFLLSVFFFHFFHFFQFFYSFLFFIFILFITFQRYQEHLC